MNDFCKKWKLDQNKLPQHLGIIMDGNGRWAKSYFLPRTAGHNKGVERAREISEACGKLGISALTLYVFSEENWQRPEDEVKTLMNILRKAIKNEGEAIFKNNARFRVIGNKNRLEPDLVEMITALEKKCETNTGMHLVWALSYGSRNEIVRATQKLCQLTQSGQLKTNDIDEHIFSNALDTHGLPDLDLIIRTSGEQRLSNFLLWQLSYAEVIFENTLWPDFTTEHLVTILKQFATKERRFGMTSAQIEAKINMIPNQKSMTQEASI